MTIFAPFMEKSQRNKLYFMLLLAASFLTGAVLKQLSIAGPLPIPLYVLLPGFAFAGSIGLLADYAWRNRNSFFAVPPALLAIEILADALRNARLESIAFVLSFLGAATFLAYGLLFLIRGIQLWPQMKRLGAQFVVLGLLAGSIVGREFQTYFPDQYNTYALGWRILYLAIFAWLLFIDISTDFRRHPELKREGQLVHAGLLVISILYFVQFVFK